MDLIVNQEKKPKLALILKMFIGNAINEKQAFYLENAINDQKTFNLEKV